MQRSLVIALMAVIAFHSAEAQSSIGLPPRVRVSLGPYAGLDGSTGMSANLGVIAYKDIVNPTLGMLGFQFEAYGGAASNGGWTGAAAVGLRSPSLRLGTGLEVDLRNGEVAPFLSIMHPILRGGLFGGGLIHASWVPGGQNTFRAGVALPVAQLLTGEGRPLRDHVRIVAEKEPGPGISGDMRDYVLRVNEVVVPPLNDLRQTRALFASNTQTTATAIIAAYHDKIDRTLGRETADTLRAILLDKLLLPYNKLLGQKREPDVLEHHRKILFYDLLESDRYRGAMIVTGMGVGELFSGPGWDDRAAIVKGPAAHEVKRQAARLLIRNGFNVNRLPVWLQASVDVVPAAMRTPTPQFDPNPTRTMQLHNDVGYGDKSATVAKAMLYSLLHAGAVVKVANPLWINPLWGSLLLGHSLRGGRVLIVSPSHENSFFNASVMSLVSDQLAQLIDARRMLDEAIKRSGGMLGIGIYDINMSAADVPARIDTALSRRSRTPWLQKLEPFSKEVIDSQRAVSKSLRMTIGNGSSETPANERSKLHLKVQFVASAEAWEDLFLQKGWGAALAEYYRSIAKLSQTRPQVAEFHKVDPTTVSNVGGTLALRQEMMVKEPERVLYYMIFGSFNEDYRSALLDGEAVIVISEFGAAVGMPDFILLPSLCTWVESEEELHRYLPRRVGWLTRFLKILY